MGEKRSGIMKEAILYKKTKNSGVQCTACNWRCSIQPSRFGVCGVRKNLNGKLYLMVYGKVASFNIDPVEKKPLYHFLPGSKIFSLGTIGCNFSCGFCQNFEISQVAKGNAISDFGYPLTPNEIIKTCLEQNIPSIAFTYNEPTIFAEYCVGVMKEAKKHNIYGVFVTNGYETPETLNLLEGYIDAYNVDLKSFSEKYYQKTCGVKLQPVLETIKEIYKRKKWQEITTLIVPGQNDSIEEITEIARYINNISPDIPWHISAFHPDYKMTNISPTSPEKLFEAYQIGKKVGLNYIYTGNISDNRFSNTICPKCNNILIERNDHYQTKIIATGTCPNCQTKIPGIWN